MKLYYSLIIAACIFSNCHAQPVEMTEKIVKIVVTPDSSSSFYSYVVPTCLVAAGIWYFGVPSKILDVLKMPGRTKRIDDATGRIDKITHITNNNLENHIITSQENFTTIKQQNMDAKELYIKSLDDLETTMAKSDQQRQADHQKLVTHIDNGAQRISHTVDNRFDQMDKRLKTIEGLLLLQAKNSMLSGTSGALDTKSTTDWSWINKLKSGI